jgi:hypothetical protein
LATGINAVAALICECHQKRRIPPPALLTQGVQI